MNEEKYFDQDSYATLPGGISLSVEKLKSLRPELYSKLFQGLDFLDFLLFYYWHRTTPRRFSEGMIAYTLDKCVCQPAMVVNVSPFLVAIYSEDMDAIVVLRYAQKLLADYELRIGDKLLSINSYNEFPEIQEDMEFGENPSVGWTGIKPYIAEFLSDDKELIAKRKKQITEDEWQILSEKAAMYRAKYPTVWRDGRPFYSAAPLVSISNRKINEDDTDADLHWLGVSYELFKKNIKKLI